MKKINKILSITFTILMGCLCFAGCTKAETVTYNIQQEADQFNVYRRMTFVNLYTNNLLYEVTGYFSLQTTYENNYQGQQEIAIIIETGKDTYQMHYFSIAENVCYVIEQVENTNTNPYHWEIVWYITTPEIV